MGTILIPYLRQSLEKCLKPCQRLRQNRRRYREYSPAHPQIWNPQPLGVDSIFCGIKYFYCIHVEMPANMKGGKGYKKKKKPAEGNEADFIERREGQMPARVLRVLGNRNVLCFSNDNIIRMCHICGKMKGRVFIEVGDIVLITIRDFSSSADASTSKKVKLGDVVGKYSAEQYNLLKKERDINSNLFLKLEVTNGFVLADLGKDCTNTKIKEDGCDVFDFEHSSDSDQSDSESSGDNTKTTIQDTRGSNKVSATRIAEYSDVNIDDI